MSIKARFGGEGQSLTRAGLKEALVGGLKGGETVSKGERYLESLVSW